MLPLEHLRVKNQEPHDLKTRARPARRLAGRGKRRSERRRKDGRNGAQKERMPLDRFRDLAVLEPVRRKREELGADEGEVVARHREAPHDDAVRARRPDREADPSPRVVPKPAVLRVMRAAVQVDAHELHAQDERDEPHVPGPQGARGGESEHPEQVLELA